MTNHHAANVVFALHIVFVALALAGGLGVLVSPWWMAVHIPIVLWSAVINLVGGTCPLTPLEVNLRGEAGDPGLDDGFIAHYIGPRVYPDATPRQLEVLAGAFIIVWNLLAYLLIWWWLRSH